VAANMTTIQGHLVPNGYEQITSLSSSVSLTVPDKTVLAIIQPTGQNVRWRDDGTDPTSTVGMRLVANDILFYAGKMGEIEFIQESASAVLIVTYYRNNG